MLTQNCAANLSKNICRVFRLSYTHPGFPTRVLVVCLAYLTCSCSNEFEDQNWDPYNDICAVKSFTRTTNAIKKVRNASCAEHTACSGVRKCASECFRLASLFSCIDAEGALRSALPPQDPMSRIGVLRSTEVPRRAQLRAAHIPPPSDVDLRAIFLVLVFVLQPRYCARGYIHISGHPLFASFQALGRTLAALTDSFT